jgi:hypothetical protein
MSGNVNDIMLSFGFPRVLCGAFMRLPLMATGDGAGRAYFAILPTIRRATSRSIPGRWVARMIHRRRRRWVRFAGRNDDAVRLPAA